VKTFQRNILLLVLFTIDSDSSPSEFLSVAHFGWLVVMFSNSGRDLAEIAGEVSVLAYSTLGPL
jgi:hypothetical protein